MNKGSITSAQASCVPTDDKSFKRIVEGEFDDLPEQAFYMRGGIEEVLEAAEKMKAGV